MANKAPKGTVTIKVRGKGKILHIALPRTFFGIRKEFSLGIPATSENYKFAELQVKRMELDFLSGNFDISLEKYKLSALPSEPAIDRLNTLPEIYQQYINSRKKLVSPSTWKNTYVNTLNHLNRCPYKWLKDASKIKDWAIENLTVDAANRILMQVNAACNWAVEREMLSVNPFKGKSKIKGSKKSKPKIHPFGDREKAEILNAFEESEKWKYLLPIIKFFFLTGCRTSEALAVKWKHIKPDCSEINFEEAIVQAQGGAKRKRGTKQSAQRSFPCNSQLQELLRSIRWSAQPFDLDRPVFTRLDGSAIAASDLRSAWYGKGGKPGLVKQLAIDGKIEAYRPQYNTRHTFITQCLEAGISPVQIAEWVGNSAKIIFDRYAGIVNKKEVPEF